MALILVLQWSKELFAVLALTFKTGFVLHDGMTAYFAHEPSAFKSWFHGSEVSILNTIRTPHDFRHRAAPVILGC
jgi:hypothetical protein